ncbi:MAG: extracellular solute-binding protein [Geodermatophilaceae bacterium]|nr:extracellular solute-binding protein [Geodermatophilaceae bacterium]MDQ3466280.1 extracellular solute-binding protein [Actinomycetota bacterium]
MRRTVRLIAVTTGLALAATGCLGGTSEEQTDTERGAEATEVTLTIAANAVSGGKNAEEADWIENYVIPEFVAAQEAEGVDVTVEFQSSGVDDEDYKSKIALDLRTGSGADIVSLDGIWVGEFAEAGYILPLTEVVGDTVEEWDGWEQIPDAVQANMSFNDERYGVPAGSDGRVLFYNKELFAQAGLPEDWQPTSWTEILDAARALQGIDGVTPIQLNAGTAMGEATTMQGVLPLLVGTGERIYDEDGGTWQGNTQNIRDVLGFYQTVYGEELGDPTLQQEAQGRDKSFAEFAAGTIGILMEGDYFWRSVIEPTQGVAPMANRDEVVGFTRLPAMEPGSGIEEQDFVSMSGGGGRVLNPATEFPQQAWELLTFMNSADATIELIGDGARLTQREDVNSEILADDPMLSFIAEEVVPLSAYRPGLAVYPQISVALQQATLDVVTGMPPEEAAAKYQQAVEAALGGADDIASD